MNNIKIIEPKKYRTIKKIKTKLAAVFKKVDIEPINFYPSLKIQ